MNCKVFVTIELSKEFEYPNCASLEEAESLALGEIEDTFPEDEYDIVSIDSISGTEDEELN